MYPNQKIAAPFGDVYFVNTPYLDKVSDRLYNEERQRKLQEEKDAKILDDEFAKNMAGIRDADVPELAKAYGDWKIANKFLIKNKSATPEQQLEVLRKKADMYKIISESKAFRDQEKAYGADIIKNNKKYKKDAGVGMTGILRTPVSKMRGQDVFTPLRYEGNLTNFADLLKKSQGIAKDITEEREDNPNGLETRVTRGKRFNNAKEYADILLGGVADRQADDDFVRTYGDISPESFELTKQHYDLMMQDPVIARRFGNPEPFREPKSEAEKTAQYMGMVYALQNTPTVKSTIEPNWQGRFKAKNAEWAKRNRITFGQSMAKIAANKEAGKPLESVGYLSDEVAAEVGEVASLPPVVANKLSLDPNVEYTIVYEDKVDPERMMLIKGGKKDNYGFIRGGVPGIDIQQPNGKVRKAYIVNTGTGDWIGEDAQPISRERVRDEYINKVSPTKFKAQIGTKASENTNKKKTYNSKTGKFE